VKTYAVDNSMRQRINNFIKKQILEGRQAYIICPLVDESDEIEAKSALKTAEKIAKEDLKILESVCCMERCLPAKRRGHAEVFKRRN